MGRVPMDEGDVEKASATATLEAQGGRAGTKREEQARMLMKRSAGVLSQRKR